MRRQRKPRPAYPRILRTIPFIETHPIDDDVAVPRLGDQVAAIHLHRAAARGVWANLTWGSSPMRSSASGDLRDTDASKKIVKMGMSRRRHRYVWSDKWRSARGGLLDLACADRYIAGITNPNRRKGMMRSITARILRQRHFDDDVKRIIDQLAEDDVDESRRRMRRRRDHAGPNPRPALREIDGVLGSQRFFRSTL
jgi:hypothetical protein